MNVRRINQITTYHRLNQLSTNITELNAKFFRSSRPEVLCKDGFFLQNSQEDTCVGVSFKQSCRPKAGNFKKIPFLWSYITLANNVSHNHKKLYLHASWFIYQRELLNPLKLLLCLVEKFLWIVEMNLSCVKTSQYCRNSS